jgi:GH43 family beta-xylosidase
MSQNLPSRRFLLAAASGAALGLPLKSLAREPGRIINPIIEHRADGQILREGGWYYFMGTVPAYDRLVLRRARTLAGLATAKEVTLWTRPSQGRMGGYIWAPELHRFDGKWHVYFGAGDHDDVFHVRTHVLVSADPDPMRARWEVMGQVQTPWDTFNLDSTLFEHRGVRYLVWAQHEPGIDTNSNLYIAPLATATTFAAAPARLSIPELPWEIIGYKVNEGPAVLVRNGRVFITYSASATDEHYCLGMLTADDKADLMDPKSWSKSPVPVFKTCPEHNVWGPGHNSFTVDEQGRDMLLFHARDYREIEGDPLNDPNRSERLQYIHYRADGTPDFGLPVANGPLVA